MALNDSPHLLHGIRQFEAMSTCMKAIPASLASRWNAVRPWLSASRS